MVCTLYMSRVKLSQQIFRLRLIYAVLPTIFICTILWYAVLGEQGILRYHMLKQSLNIVRNDTTATEAHNRDIRNQITRYRQSPRLLQLHAADRLYRTDTNATVYRFNE